MSSDQLYGLMAEFPNPETLTEAARRTHKAGYRLVDAFTPYPVEALWEALEHKRSWVPAVVLTGGICGGLGGLTLQYWSSVIHYPMIVGGRPFGAWPGWVVVTFECTILLAAISGLLGMILLNKLPQPYHPVFNVESFRKKASSEGFFLLIESADEQFDHAGTKSFLQGLNPIEVSDVEE
ncbi:MAG: DUF3341 domain-containing protein [Acidobacteriota bacterium]